MRGKVEKRKCPFVNSLRLQRAVDIVFTMPRSAILDAPGVPHHGGKLGDVHWIIGCFRKSPIHPLL